MCTIRVHMLTSDHTQMPEADRKEMGGTPERWLGWTKEGFGPEQ